MVTCSAYGCRETSSAEKGKEKTKKTKKVSWFKFPDPVKEADRLKLWENKVGVKNFKATQFSKLCENHFEDSMIEVDLRLKYMGDPKRCVQLVEGAVPTKFRRDSSGEWRVGPPGTDDMNAAVAGGTHCKQRREPAEREHTVQRLALMEQKRIVEELLRDKTVVPAKVPRKTSKVPRKSAKRPICSGTNVSEMAAVPAQQDMDCTESSVCEVYPQVIYGHPGVVLKDHAYAPKSTAQIAIQKKHTGQSDPVTVSHESCTVNKSAISESAQISRKNKCPRQSAPAPVSYEPSTVNKLAISESAQTSRKIKRPRKSAEAPVSHEPSTANKCAIATPPVPVFDEFSDMEDISTQGGDSQGSKEMYSPDSSEESDSSEDISQDDDLPPSTDRTYLVFEPNLEHLMKMCQKCGKPVITITKKEFGSMVKYSLECLDGHTVTWRSQPLIRKAALGNLMLAAAVLFTGLTYTRLASFAKAINLAILAQKTYDGIQRDRLFPVIKEAWQNERSALVSQCTEGPVSVSGDSRCDSPGHNAKYGTYTLMECGRPDEREKILNIQLVQCTEVKNSNAMEAEGLQRGLQELKDEGVEIGVLATDRHVQVRKIMSTEHPEINHQFDVWHVAKGITTKLNVKAKLKKNAELLPWIQCIINHFWWSCATCNGDKQELRERWISILHHVVNKHRWTGCVKFKKCQHTLLTAAECRKKAWLKPGSSSFLALQEIVMNKYLLGSLPNLVDFYHTGSLEVFHNVILKYCPKRQHFGYRGMAARMMLAGLDWNSMEREPVLNEDGSQKLDQVFSKRRKTWVLRNRYKRNSGMQVQGLMKRTIQAYRDRLVLPPIVSPVLPSNISRVEKPNKEEAEAKHRTRFKKN